MDLCPVHENESKWPGSQDPTDGASDADESELFLCILDVRKSNLIGNGDGGYVKEAMDEHQ